MKLKIFPAMKWEIIQRKLLCSLMVVIILNWEIMAIHAELAKIDFTNYLLGKHAPTPEELDAMDLNTDRVVDVADLVRFINEHPTNVEGIWMANVALSIRVHEDGMTTSTMPVPINYPILFTLRMQSGGMLSGEVVKGRGFDPTKTIMDQIGAINKISRPVYEPSPMIPVGFPVQAVLGQDKNSLQILLHDIPTSSSQYTAYNPFPVPLLRDIQLTITGLPNSGQVAEGLVMEHTYGLLSENKPVALKGAFLLTYCGNDYASVVPAGAMERQSLAMARKTVQIESGYRLQGSVYGSFPKAETSSASPTGGSATQTIETASFPSQDMLFAYADYQNIRAKDGSETDPLSVHLGSGGYVFSGSPGEANAGPGTVLSFGQPFAGNYYMISADAVLPGKADPLLAASTQFFTNDGIIRGTHPINMPADFNESILADAEKYYVALTEARPYLDQGVLGILNCRMRTATAHNLLADASMLELNNLKFSLPAASDSRTGLDILNQELVHLDAASTQVKKSVDALLELFADKQFRGVGAFLRRECRSTVAANGLDQRLTDTLRITAESLRRLADIRMKRAEKKLLKGFYSGDRAAALEDLKTLEVYLTLAIHALSAFGEPTHFGLTGIGRLASQLEEIRSFELSIRAGYNHLGFHPDFVPFLEGNDLNDNRDTVKKLKDFATSVVSLAKDNEVQATNDRNTFTADRATYERRVQDIKSSAYDRLKALCGVVENPSPSSGQPQYEPDIFTFMEASTSQRTTMLTELLPGWPVKSFGQIAIQHQNISNAHDRIKQAINNMDNLIKEMEIHDLTAQEIANDLNNLAQIHLKTGEKLGMLQRQKGILRQQAAIAAANASRDNSRFGIGAKIFKKVGLVGSIAAIALGGPGVAEVMLSFMSGTVPNPSSELTMVTSTAQQGINLVDEYLRYKNTMDQANISGNLAMAEAGVDAAMEEVRAMDQAEVVYQQRREVLARNEEQLKILALRQANYALDIQIAQRDAIKEEMQLANMISEAVSLMAELSRDLRQEYELQQGSWYPDWRAVSVASQEDAEASFRWAQGACYMVLRALDYHLNQSQNLQGDYALLYRSRRAKHLDALLVSIDQSLTMNPLASSPPGQALLSLKYDLLSRQLANLDDKGLPLAEPGSGAFSYRNGVDDRVLTGTLAYQARLRDFLQQHLRREPMVEGGYRYVLEFEFSTNLFPAGTPKMLPDGTYLPQRENPFWDSGLTINQVILGSVLPNYPGISQNYHGITLNITGSGLPSSDYCKARLTMAGNMYQRKSYNAADKAGGIIAYSTYNQMFPRSLKLPNDWSEPPFESFTSVRTGVFSPTINGVQVGSLDPRVLAFTDRAVACDRWIFKMTTDDGRANWEFLPKLYTKLNPLTSNFDYISDIQFKIGWVAKFAQPSK